MMVQKVRVALNIHFQGASVPKMLFTDRGNGFYNAGTGRITKTYRAALRAHGLQAFFATDASVQPGQLQELMLHETVVSWLRRRLAKTLRRSPWEETSEEYGARLNACAAYINEHHDVDNLCRGLPARLHELKARGRPARTLNALTRMIRDLAKKKRVFCVHLCLPCVTFSTRLRTA